MEMGIFNIINRVNGVPMVSDCFATQTFVTLVAHYRHALFNSSDNLSNYIEPVWVNNLYRERNKYIRLEYPGYSELSNEEQQAVENAIVNIKNVMPEWQVYFSLPVLFKKLTQNESMVSLTNHNIPQVIFLGVKAFKSETWLTEVIIHEMAHIWLGMLCEIDSFHEHSKKINYTLPSGTKNKDARGVIFASHFSACVIKYMLKKRQVEEFSPQDEERFIWLKKYFSGCINQLVEMNELKKIGKEIVDVMKREVCYG